MRLFIAICFDENMLDALNEIQDDESMRVNGISLMKSERGKHGMVYSEIGYVRAL